MLQPILLVIIFKRGSPGWPGSEGAPGPAGAQGRPGAPGRPGSAGNVGPVIYYTDLDKKSEKYVFIIDIINFIIYFNSL